MHRFPRSHARRRTSHRQLAVQLVSPRKIAEGDGVTVPQYPAEAASSGWIITLLAHLRAPDDEESR